MVSLTATILCESAESMRSIAESSVSISSWLTAMDQPHRLSDDIFCQVLLDRGVQR